MKNNFTQQVARKLLNTEMGPHTLARLWRGLEIHFVKKQSAPFTILEVNRISTVMFNLKTMDGDVFDETYSYIVAYDRKNGEIVSFYRFILCKDAIHNPLDIHLSTAKYFNLSQEFVSKILPVTIELGRSVVNKTAKNQEDALQAVWIGLGVLAYEYYLHPKSIKVDYFFGKFSLQWSLYNEKNRDMILFLFSKHFPPLRGADDQPYITPMYGFKTHLDFTGPESTLTSTDYKADRKILFAYLKDIGLPLPKLADSYASLGGLTSYGAISNEELCSWENAILTQIGKISDSYIRRFVDGYQTINPNLFI
ncbi:MAG: GNAT family N-acetyltransferase [candidate division SR1 bacterium]|nr:GNAT family N-acetyltransferase [candidate division SR1 bacterium]